LILVTRATKPASNGEKTMTTKVECYEVRTEPDGMPWVFFSYAKAEREARRQIEKGRTALIYEIHEDGGERFLCGAN
jgi:hypothetical protein